MDPQARPHPLLKLGAGHDRLDSESPPGPHTARRPPGLRLSRGSCQVMGHAG